MVPGATLGERPASPGPWFSGVIRAARNCYSTRPARRTGWPDERAPATMSTTAVQLCRSPNEDAHLSRRRVERMRGVSISLIRQYEEAAEQLGLARSLVMRRAVERGLEGAVASLRRDLGADAGGRPREAGSHVVQLAAEAERRVNRLGKRLRKVAAEQGELPGILPPPEQGGRPGIPPAQAAR